MVLRESEAALRVRTYLLASEEEHRVRRSRGRGRGCGRSLDAHVEGGATRTADRYCAPSGEQSSQVRGLLEAQGRMVCAVRARLLDVQEDIAGLRREVRSSPCGPRGAVGGDR